MVDLPFHLPRLVRGAARRRRRAETAQPEPWIPLWPGAVRMAIVVGGAGLGWGAVVWLFRLVTP